jgi:hypothetical protein
MSYAPKILNPSYFAGLDSRYPHIVAKNVLVFQWKEDRSIIEFLVSTHSGAMISIEWPIPVGTQVDAMLEKISRVIAGNI